MVTMKLMLVILCGLLVTPADTAKILLIPFHHGGHINLLATIGRGLKNHGHDVYEIVTSKYANLATEKGIIPLTPNVTVQVAIAEKVLVDEGITNLLIGFPKIINMARQHYREIMADTDIMKKLKELQFDLAIVDSFDINLPAYLIPYKLSLPYVSISPRPDPWSVRVSAFPSVEGMFPLMLMTEESNLIHRTLNTAVYFVMQAIASQSFISPFNDNSMFTDLVPEKENVGFYKLFMQSEMFLVNSNVYCLDEARVSAPHYQYVPGIGAHEAQPLTDDIAQIFERSKHGVILLSFGSAFKIIAEDRLSKMVSVFGKLKYDVIIRHTGKKPDDIPENLHIVSWLPQNDILGNPKTKLFITHVGLNGLLESVYHGVPMLLMPHSGDQFANARKGEAKGFGKTVDPADFTAEQLEDVMTELLENTKYKNNIQKCSEIVRSIPAAQDTVVFWVEHILRFGGSHLRPYYLDMPLWKFLMCDVFLVFVVLNLTGFFLVKFCCRKLCCREKGHQKVD